MSENLSTDYQFKSTEDAIAPVAALSVIHIHIAENAIIARHQSILDGGVALLHTHGAPAPQSQASARLLRPPHGLSRWFSQHHPVPSQLSQRMVTTRGPFLAIAQARSAARVGSAPC